MRLLLFGLTCCLLWACDPDPDFVTGDAVQLRFEADTLSFDTVFAARGSATLPVRVYNDAKEPIRIDRVFVEGRTGVTFTFNADGTMGPEAKDVVIWGSDSIYVFVEVEVDPSSSLEESPFIAEDRLVFEFGNFREEIVLQAFGQNAVYLNGFRRGVFFQPICASGTFTLPNDLPVVIYGSMFVDSCTVRALAGTELYFHGGLQRNEFAPSGFVDGFLYTLPNGRLELLGTSEDPILLATDRLETGFERSAGAYRGLIFGPGSTGNRLEHTELRNAFIGVQADSLAEVTLDNVIISNTAGPAIATNRADLTLRNSLLHSAQESTLRITNGGRIRIDHTTVASYTGREAVALELTNFRIREESRTVEVAPLNVRIRNSILAGFDESELVLGDALRGSEPGFFEIGIENSVVRTDPPFLNFVFDSLQLGNFYDDVCQDCYNLQFGDTLFVDTRDQDYQLDSVSVARDLGVFLPELPRDLRDNPRDGNTPDAGALEWQPGG